MPVLIIFCILEAPSEIIVGLDFDHPNRICDKESTFFKEKLALN